MPPKKNSDNQEKVFKALNNLAPELSGLAGLKQVANGDFAVHGAGDGLRVEYLNLLLVYPDPVQPRRILPERIYQQFWAGRLTQTQALKELVSLAQIAARQNARPFNSVTDFLNTDDEEEPANAASLSHEEQLVKDLVNLAATIRDDGQVNPLTVVDVSDGTSIQYRIETGERRYWATWLLRDFFPGYNHDGKIPCIVVPADKASTFRQAKENTARAGLNAIAMARQVALLLLTVHGYEIPNEAVSMDFYRQALELDLRGKRESTAEVMTALGGMSKRQFSYYKALLKLADEAIELADRHNLDEKKLRYVIQLQANEDQVEIIRHIIRHNLTAKQVQDLIEKGEPGFTNSDEDNVPRLPKSAMQIAKLALKPDAEMDANLLAQAFVGLERDRAVAKARLRALRELLEEAELYIEGV
jgi:ParB-like chromosome segregation protein Spo0J